MSAGKKAADDLRAHYTTLPAGTVLWHVYPSQYRPRSFNPSSRNRFAAPPPPDREMFYAGDSSECALWESVLRNLVIEDKQPQHIDPGLLEGRSIAELTLGVDTQILDLRSPHFRHLSSNPARHTEWQRLATVPERDYPQTHAAAKELLAMAPEAAGLCWHSRQIGQRTVYVFYDPPHSPGRFHLVDGVTLDQPAGWELVDAALRIVKVERLGADSLESQLLEEIPPEDTDEDPLK